MPAVPKDIASHDENEDLRYVDSLLVVVKACKMIGLVDHEGIAPDQDNEPVVEVLIEAVAHPIEVLIEAIAEDVSRQSHEEAEDILGDAAST